MVFRDFYNKNYLKIKNQINETVECDVDRSLDNSFPWK